MEQQRVGADVGKDDRVVGAQAVQGQRKVARRTGSLRAASTKKGPRGGRKTVRPKRTTTPRQRTAARRNVKKAQAARHR